MTQGIFAQIKVDTCYSPTELVKNMFLGQGVIAGNVTFSGPKFAIGLYHDDSATLGFTNGILLTTGNALYSRGPNNSPRMGWASSSPGDKDLQLVAHGRTHDASVLEFDFVAANDSISFNFVFASEEYLEYVGSKFNDVFGFFIMGKDSLVRNIAVLPDNKTPITVNTVNNKLNKHYFIDNTFFNTTDPWVWNFRKRKVVKNKRYGKRSKKAMYNTQFDGFTTVLRAHASVIPNQVYHIKLAISDVGDAMLDSGVFLESGSFESRGGNAVAITYTFPEKIPTKEQPEFGRTSDFEDKKIVIYNVEFEFDSYKLPARANNIINNVYQLLTNNPTWTVTLSGHTDNRGSNEYNEVLSRRRSLVVRGYLERLGIEARRIEITYYGELIPIETNTTAYGRARNRRVEFRIHKHAASR